MYFDYLVQLLNDRGVGVDLQDVLLLVEFFLGLHRGGCVYSLPVRGIVHQVGNDDHRLVDEPCGNLDVLDILSELLLCVVNEGLVHLSQVLHLLPEIIVLVGLPEVVFGYINDFEFFVVLEVVDDGLVQRVLAQDYLVTLSDQSLNQWRVLQ